MIKWAGKYEALFEGMCKKYGPPGEPIPQPQGPGSKGSKKATVTDHHDLFVELIAKATPPADSGPLASVVDAKAANELNGLETSSFTLCTRIRPVLPHEEGRKGEYFTCVVPGEVRRGSDHTEEALVLLPKMSVTGKPKLDKKAYDFDHTFGAYSTNEEIYHSVGKSLVARAKAGQVGVVFAYGQTGSGKTHTMSGLLDSISDDLFVEEGAEPSSPLSPTSAQRYKQEKAQRAGGNRAIDFSYFEVMDTVHAFHVIALHSILVHLVGTAPSSSVGFPLSCTYVLGPGFPPLGLPPNRGGSPEDRGSPGWLHHHPESVGTRSLLPTRVPKSHRGGQEQTVHGSHRGAMHLYVSGSSGGACMWVGRTALCAVSVCCMCLDERYLFTQPRSGHHQGPQCNTLALSATHHTSCCDLYTYIIYISSIYP